MYHSSHNWKGKPMDFSSSKYNVYKSVVEYDLKH